MYDDYDNMITPSKVFQDVTIPVAPLRFLVARKYRMMHNIHRTLLLKPF